jgi:hypothetical protein
MPQPANKLAPEVTGVNRLLDFIVQRLPANMFPTNARTLLETAQGNRDPITESNFSPEELAAIKEMITLKGGDVGNIQYEDYDTLVKTMRERGQLPVSKYPGLLSMGDAFGNVQTTLGRFNYARDANGNMVVQDTYDFNPQHGSAGPYKLLRDYAGEKIPRGYGRPVNVNLGR